MTWKSLVLMFSFLAFLLAVSQAGSTQGVRSVNGSGITLYNQLGDVYSFPAQDGTVALINITQSWAEQKYPDDIRIVFGTGLDSEIQFDTALNALTITTFGADQDLFLNPTGDIFFNDARMDVRTVENVADSGDGNPATLTLTPASSFVNIDCADADGCDITMGETGVQSGTIVHIINGVSGASNVSNFTDTAGVSELAGNFSMGLEDSLSLMYKVDRWVELARSDN